MNISLTPELEQIVSEKVASGMYHSASEVIRDALRLLKERDEIKEYRLEEFRREIAIGLEQLKRGEKVTLDQTVIDDVKARGRRKLAEQHDDAA